MPLVALWFALPRLGSGCGFFAVFLDLSRLLRVAFAPDGIWAKRDVVQDGQMGLAAVVHRALLAPRTL